VVRRWNVPPSDQALEMLNSNFDYWPARSRLTLNAGGTCFSNRNILIDSACLEKLAPKTCHPSSPTGSVVR
jgi:hypothetical protein